MDAGIIVLHLVVIPDHRERMRGVRSLQIRIELVQRVLVAVALQADGLAAEALGIQCAPTCVLQRAVLVQVVASMQHQVDIALGDIAQHRVVAAVPGLAGTQRQPQLLQLRVRQRRGAEMTDRAFLIAIAGETIVVVTARAQAADFHMYRMGQLGHRCSNTALHQPAHARIFGHEPAHRHRPRWHATTVERVRGQPRPQHRALRIRIAGGNAEGERIAPQPRPRAGRGQPRHRRQRDRRPRALPRHAQQATTAFRIDRPAHQKRTVAVAITWRGAPTCMVARLRVGSAA